MNSKLNERANRMAQSITWRWVLTLLALTTISKPLSAATITVSNTHDSGTGSLRQALLSAASSDTINFSATGVITLTTGQLLLTKNLTVTGPGAGSLAISGNTNSRVFEIGSNAAVSISDLTIRDGHAPEKTNVTGSIGNGGGILNSGTLALTRCTVSGNTAGNYTYYSMSALPGAGGAGGGIYNVGTLTLTTCTVCSNAAGIGGTGNPGALGGNGGAIFNAGDATLTACTVTRNQAGSGGRSGLIIGGVGGVGGSGGGICNATNAPPARLRNTLVAENFVGVGGPVRHLDGAAGHGPSGTGPDLFGTFNSQGHNLVGTPASIYWTGLTNDANNDLVGPLDPMIGPLQNNGGPTFTMALLVGSPALDSGDDALLNAPFNLATDQRGLPRKSGAHVDIGAFELQVAGAPPQLAGPTMLGNGAFGFTFSNSPGASFTVLAATIAAFPLNQWTVLQGLVEIEPGRFQFTDSQATNHPARFYRIRRP